MHFKMLSAICFSLDQSRILSSGNGLNSKLSGYKKLCARKKWIAGNLFVPISSQVPAVNIIQSSKEHTHTKTGRHRHARI